jgi:putative heme-binding domain-containing protein
LASDVSKSADLRVAALGAVVARMKLDSKLFDFALAQLDREKLPLQRMATAQALGNAALNDEQLAKLADAVAQAGPLELPLLLPAFEKSKTQMVGQRLIQALDRSPGLTSLSAEQLRRALGSYPAKVQANSESLVKRLSVDVEQQKSRLAELEQSLVKGESSRGREVFFGTTASCFACHAIESQGGKIGPDLSKIGAVRTRRDLLEAIAFPSASLARGYEPYSIGTFDGKTYSGVLRRETADAVHLVTTDRAEIRVPRSEIETMHLSRVSIMPQGLDVQLSPQQLSDLIAYLGTLK